MTAFSKSISDGTNHSGISGSGETLYSFTVDEEIRGITRFAIDESITGTNSSGTGGYPGAGIRLVNSNGDVLYRFNDVGSWTYTSDSADTSSNALVQITQESSTTNSANAESTSSPSASATPTMYAEVFDAKGGGGTDDKFTDYSGTIYIDGITKPTNFTVTSTTEDQLDLSWDDSGDEAGYYVYRAQSSGSSTADYTQIADLAADTTSYTDTSLEDGERYYYRVEAYDGNGNTFLSDEDSAVTILPAGSITAISETASDTLTVEWSRSDDSSDGTWEVYRSTSSGSLGTQVYSTTDLTVRSYADSGLSSDTKYYYIVRRATDHTSVDSTQDWAAILPAPTNMSADAVTGDDIDLSWTDNATVESGYRVYRSRDGGSTWAQASGDLAADTTTFTDANLLDGEEYVHKVEVFGNYNTKESGTTAATTTVLPDVSAPTLGNGVEDEIAVDWTDVTDYGEYDIQYRETSSSTWLAGPTVGEATTSATIQNLEDGEEYEVRMRTQTEHVDGSWTSPVSIVTKFPGITNLTVDAVTQTSVDLSWTDNADNEDGITVERAKMYASGLGPWRELTTLDPNTELYTDNTAQPGREYHYRLTIFTEHTDATASTSTTTTSSGIRQTNVSANGWRVEVEHPNLDQPLTASTLDGPQWLPTLNGRPECRIPVPYDEKWDAQNFERAPMRVWNDATELEIDELHAVEHETGTSTKRTVLVGRGGSELRDRVQTEYDSKEAHLAAKELVENNTSYTANVDDPSNGATETPMQSASTTSAISDALEAQPSSTDPWEVANGTLHPLQTCYLIEAEDATLNFSTRVDDTRFSGNSASTDAGSAMGLTNLGDKIEYTFNPDYTIPASEFGIAIRYEGDASGDIPEVSWYVDGELLGTYNPGTYQSSTSSPSQIHTDPIADGDLPAPSSDISGSTTLTLEVTQDLSSAESWYVDTLAPLDQRFSYTLDNSTTAGTDGGAYLDGPETHPNALQVPFASVGTAKSVVGGRAEATFSDTSGGQAMQLSNDDGSNYYPNDGTETNTESIDVDFPSGGGSLKLRVTLDRYGTRDDQTPRTGYQAQALDAFDTYADVEETPILTNKVYDGQMLAVLKQIATFGNFIFEVRRNGDGTTSVEWTQPGQRQTTDDPAIVDYTSRKKNTRYRKAVIYGASRPVSNDRFTANHGTAVSLTRQEIVEGKVTVYDPSDGTQFVEDEDYSITYRTGEITTLSSGSMTDGAAYAIDYSQRPVGSYEAGDFDAAKHDTIVETIPTASSNRECEQAALYLVDELGTPRLSASVTLSRLDAGQSLVDDLNLEKLPGDSGMRTEDVTQQPQNVQLEMGSRPRLGEAIARVQERLGATERKV